MAHVRKGQLTPPKEWAKHLRFWKKFYWRAERREAQRQARAEARARPPRRAFDFTKTCMPSNALEGTQRNEPANLFGVNRINQAAASGT